MYVPKIYEAPSIDHVKSFIEKNGFATLTGIGRENQIITSHIPLMLYVDDDEEYLLGHVALGNPLRECLNENQEILAVFMEQHAYISSSWYADINVPTWNYIAVHISGKAKIIEGEALVRSLSDLVNKYEVGREKAFSVESMPTDMLHREMKGIVGFKMSIEQIEAQYKLSQNRHDRDYSEIIAQLEKQGDQLSTQIAQDMKELRYGSDEA